MTLAKPLLRRACGIAGPLLALALAGPVPAAAEEPLSLPRLLETAVHDHPSVLARTADLASARSEVAAAHGQFLPTPSLDGEHQQGRTQATLSLQQPLWTGGRLTAGVALAQAHVAVAEAALREAQVDVANHVLAAWQAALTAAGRKQATQQEIDRLRELSDMVQRRLAAGLSGHVESDLLSARISQAQGDLAQAEADAQTAASSLAQWVGRAAPLAEAPAADDASPPRALDELLQAAASRSPTLQRLDAQIEAADRSVDQARAQIWPTVFLQVDLQKGQIPGSLAPGGRAQIGLQQSFGAGMGVAARAAVDGALAQRQAALADRDAAARDLAADIAGRVAARDAALAQERADASSLQSLQGVADSYQRMFLAGRRSWLEVLNTVREQTDAERQLQAAHILRAAATYRLMLGTGDFPWMQ